MNEKTESVEIPWKLGQGSTDDLIAHAYSQGASIFADVAPRALTRVHIGSTWAGFFAPESAGFIRWPSVTVGFSEIDYAARLHAQADRSSSRAKCYFIGVEDGPIKIGYSVDVQSRFSAIQSCSPVRLKIFAVASGGEAREEAYHYQFHEHRLHGEWFSRTPEIEAEITRLNIQTQTIAQSGVGG